jgi:hypothetical protein
MSPVGEFFAVFSISVFLLLILFQVFAIFLWRIFAKAKVKGVNSLIPFLNLYLLFVVSGQKKNYSFFVLAITAHISISILARSMQKDILHLMVEYFLWALFLFILYLYYALIRSLARSFGQDINFTIGLLIFPVFFLPLLAFSGAQYIGPDGVPPVDPDGINEIGK